MLKKHKLAVIISSLIILIPILFGLIVWEQLPENIVEHWGITGTDEAVGMRNVLVFGVPGVMLLIQLFCIVINDLLNKFREQQPKIVYMVLSLIPLITLFSSALIYSTVFGMEINVILYMSVLFGILFMIIGNYMPKCERNKFIGYRIPTTLANEENWNLTHRFGGWVSFVGGMILFFVGFFPEMLAFILFALIIIALVVAPLIYSYALKYRHIKEGKYTEEDYKYNYSKTDKRIFRIAIVSIVVVLLITAFLMFSGDITYTETDTALRIDASFGYSQTIEYDKINSVEYSTDFDTGMRLFGVNSAELLLGSFKNDEIGAYTRYTYISSNAVIVLKVGASTVVINEKTAGATESLYNRILERTMIDGSN